MRYANPAVALFIAPVVLIFGLLALGAQSRKAGQDDAQRGKYLVEEIAKCPECHTPRDQKHQLDPDQWLQGAPIWIQPAFQDKNWADFAPALAGLPNYTDDQIERVLERGEGVLGKPIQPPMHIYHMTHSDATAIILYLRSLPGGTPRR